MSTETTSQRFEEGIAATNRAFESAFNQGDASGAAAVYTANGQALPPNSEVISGREALQNFWQAVMNSGVKGVSLETVELDPCGDSVVEVGRASLRGAEGTLLDTAKFIVVWKQEDGQWKWHRDIWSSINPG